MTFLDDVQGEVHSAPSVTDPTFHRGQDTQAAFGDWFSRPLRVATIPWAEGNHIATAIYPWHAYFTNTEVYSKVKGFSRLRCKLHVKLMINASPFQYSLGIMSYRPLAGGGSDPAYSGGELANYNTITNDIPTLMSYTQMPHAHFEPQYSKGCEMELPFLYHSDWVPLISSDLAHLQHMGRLSIASYSTLRTAGTSTANPITISVYVWATEVELAGPSMILQSKDEYSLKPVSSTAYAIAAAAKSMESVPSIAPFARATGVMASSLGSVASMFGFSNPPVIDPVHNMRINYAANISSTDIPTQLEKLSMDPKNELTVDGRTVGLDGVDNMSIRYVLDRSVFYTSFQWNAADAADAIVFSTYINPSIAHVTEYVPNLFGGTAKQIQMTPSCLLGTMFANWRGPITLKFVAAASQFHRGRLRFSYDPAGPWADNQLGSMRLYQKVWDLSISNTFEYEVPYMAATSWLQNFNYAVTEANATASIFWKDRTGFAGIPTGYTKYYFNGALRVDVMSELTAPSAVNIPIFVYVNASKVEFANPQVTHSISQLSLAELQSLDAVTVNDDVVKTDIEIIEDIDHIHDVYMGEAVVSLRNVIHRSVYWDTIKPSFIGCTTSPSFDPTATQGFRQAVVRWIIPRLPMSFCVLPTSLNGSGTNGYPPWSIFNNTSINPPVLGRYKYGCNARTTPLSLIVACYAGWRGSLCWRAFIEGQPAGDIGDMNGGTSIPGIALSRLTVDRSQQSMTVLRAGDNSTFPAPANSVWNTLQGGAVVRHCKTPAFTGFTNYITYRSREWEEVNSGERSEFCGVSKGTPDQVPTVDAILPHYSSFRMLSSNPNYYFPVASGYVAPNITPPDTYDTFSINAKYTTNPFLHNPGGVTATTLDRAPSIALYNSAGVDFTGFMFLAVPTLWMYTATKTIIPDVIQNN